jgi:hypothetical protein
LIQQAIEEADAGPHQQLDLLPPPEHHQKAGGIIVLDKGEIKMSTHEELLRLGPST